MIRGRRFSAAPFFNLAQKWQAELPKWYPLTMSGDQAIGIRIYIIGTSH